MKFFHSLLVALLIVSVSLAKDIIKAKIGKIENEPVLIRGQVIQKDEKDRFIRLSVLSSSLKGKVIEIENFENDNIKTGDILLFYFDGENVNQIKLEE